MYALLFMQVGVNLLCRSLCFIHYFHPVLPPNFFLIFIIFTLLLK